MASLYDHYKTVVRPAIREEFGYGNPHQIPELVKIVLNMGVGEATADRKKIDAAVQDMTLITGQKPLVVRSPEDPAARAYLALAARLAEGEVPA